MPYFKAHIEVLVEVETQPEACDCIAEALRPILREFAGPESSFIDWRYFGTGLPSEHDGTGFDYAESFATKADAVDTSDIPEQGEEFFKGARMVLPTFEKAKPRIVITVRGGVAELDDAENWPEGLELFIVDYDNDEEDDGAFLDGRCSLAKHDSAPDGCTGQFASDAEQAWEMTAHGFGGPITADDAIGKES